MAVATAGSRALALARNQVAGSGHGKQLFRDVSGDGAPTTPCALFACATVARDRDSSRVV